MPTFTALFLLALVAGCGDSAPGSPPTAAGAGTGINGFGHGPAPVFLGSAGNYVILAKAGISSVPPSDVTGDIGLSPAAATFITGFSLTMPHFGTFSESSQVTGKVFAATYAVPTPNTLTVAVLDMEAAYTDASGRAPDYTELAAGNLSYLNLGPATYKWGTSVLIANDVTLTGSPSDVWIFQIAQGLTVESGTRIILAGGARPENIFWQVFGAVELGTTSHFEGVILSQTSIVLKTLASANGRLMAQTAVTLDSNSVTQP